MSKDLTLPNPERFGLASFAELLPARDPIIGEAPGSFAGFRDGMMRALIPFTPYECVIAENLIAIEWELVQHRRMRLASLRKEIQAVVRNAVIERERERYEEAIDALWDEYIVCAVSGPLILLLRPACLSLAWPFELVGESRTRSF